MAKVEIEFKNPDFDVELVTLGVSSKVADKIRGKAQVGEYYAVELTINDHSGEITSARFVKVQ